MMVKHSADLVLFPRFGHFPSLSQGLCRTRKATARDLRPGTLREGAGSWSSQQCSSELRLPSTRVPQMKRPCQVVTGLGCHHLGQAFNTSSKNDFSQMSRCATVALHQQRQPHALCSSQWPGHSFVLPFFTWDMVAVFQSTTSPKRLKNLRQHPGASVNICR
jgi:hypothetical protein